MNEDVKYTGLESDNDPGPMKSIEGYILSITGLNEETQEEDLHDTFGEYGTVRNIHFNLDRRTGYAKGYAFVEFEHLKEAKAAIEGLDNQLLLGKKVRVDFAFKKPPNNKKDNSDSCSSRTDSLNNSPFNGPQPLTYGKDLWDCLQILSESTNIKKSQMSSLKSFFISYKKAIDQFTQGLGKAYSLFDKEFVRSKQGMVVDTLSTALVNTKSIFDVQYKNLIDKSEMIQRDLIEPLELYYKHYYSTNTELIKQGNQFWNQLHQERTAMLFAKENYYNQMYQLQQIQLQYQELAFGNSDQSENNRKYSDELAVTGIQDKRLQSQQNKADISKNEYERCLEKLNLTIDMFETSYKPILNRIQEGDDSQINFIKYNLEKHTRYIDSMGKQFRQGSEEMNQTISMISSDTDLKIFIDTNRSLNSFLSKEIFQPYEIQKVDTITRQKQRSVNTESLDKVPMNLQNSPSKIEKQNSYNSTNTSLESSLINDNYIQSSQKYKSESDLEFELLNKETFNQDRQIVQDQMKKLLRSEPITIEEKGYLIQLMHNKAIRGTMTEILIEVTSPKQLKNIDCLKIIADIIKFLLTSDHGIWQDIRNWKECITYIISCKVQDAIKRKKRKSISSVPYHDPKEEKNIFKKGFGRLKGMLQSKEEKQKVEIKANQNLIFNELSRFVQHFINLALPYEQANDILINFCDQFQMEQSRMHLLLTELQSNQRNTQSMFTDKEQLIWSLQRRGNRLKAYGLTDTMQIAGMSIKFVDTDQTLMNILSCCKDFNEMLKEPALKQSLLRASQHRLKQKRQMLWLKLLKIDPQYIHGEFEAFHQQSLLQLSKQVEDSIDVDVSRSFNNLKQIQPCNLNKILKTYAIVNPSLDYCQGMNFIAGFLYLIFGDEALAFAVMREVISKYKMCQLFNSELPMLKLNFYQLDRLISILLTDLHSHFRDETINSSYYSSPYFITIFTSIMQMQTGAEHCQKLQRAWDYFIIKGWKAIFKIAIIILREYEEALLNMSFEIMLTQIVNLPYKFLIDQYKTEEDERKGICKFDQQMNSVKIPTMLLERLKKEFDENYKLSVRSSNSPDSKHSRSSLL